MKEFGIHDSYEGIFIIVICSKWCSSCKLFAPILEKFRDNGFIKFIEIDINENINLVREFNIHAVPALLFFKNGELLNKNI
ncbi:MAG: thioredoxin family protein, partial [Promethearchaeota archaeon]